MFKIKVINDKESSLALKISNQFYRLRLINCIELHDSELESGIYEVSVKKIEDIKEEK